MDEKEGEYKAPSPTFSEVRGLIVDIGVMLLGAFAMLCYMSSHDQFFSSIAFITLGFITKTVYDKGSKPHE